MKAKGFMLIRGVVAAWIVTLLLTLLLALVFYKFSITRANAVAAVLGVYVVANFAGGFLCGKIAGTKKFLMGIAVGAIYAVILLAASLIVHHGIDKTVTGCLTTVVLCVASAMFGGMLS